MIRRLIAVLSLLLLSLTISAEDVQLNPDHPQSYIVEKGDTLWGISAMFLKYPWHWPEIWQLNPQVENPHLIYPGDRLSLVYRDGRPMLEINRGKRTVKLSPQVREETLENAIPTIPMSEIRPFLTKPRVVGAEVMNSAPYIVASAEERLISGAGDTVYARGLSDDKTRDFSVFRGGKAYIDPDTDEVLGYEAIYTGDAVLDTFGDPSTMRLNYTNREVQVGDRLLEAEAEDFDATFMPRAPEAGMAGRIISVFDGVSQVGQYQVVVLNLGTLDGLEKGHVLTVYQAGKTIRDTVTEDRHDQVTLPDEHAGEAMVFKTFERVSYAIVMRATRAMHLNDKVQSAR